jgi:hypothetical protein
MKKIISIILVCFGVTIFGCEPHNYLDSPQKYSKNATEWSVKRQFLHAFIPMYKENNIWEEVQIEGDGDYGKTWFSLNFVDSLKAITWINDHKGKDAIILDYNNDILFDEGFKQTKKPPKKKTYYAMVLINELLKSPEIQRYYIKAGSPSIKYGFIFEGLAITTNKWIAFDNKEIYTKEQIKKIFLEHLGRYKGLTQNQEILP